MAVLTPDITLADGVPAIFKSEASLKLLSMIHRVAPHPTAVLITGETGSGKELVARAIHSFSLRNDKPWIDVNCAAFPEHLIESELFGYEKGAFSGADNTKKGFFELADGGSLFLDEVGELDTRVQVKLLRVLDGVSYFRLGGNKKIQVNVRLIAATNRDLEQEVAAGRFRRDLFHRLGQIQLRVPPLRDRAEDIEALAAFFLGKQNMSAQFSPEAMKMLKSYSWPGNVRELRNVVINAAVMSDLDTTVIGPDLLPPEVKGSVYKIPIAGGVVPSGAEEVPSGDLDEMERRMIKQALTRHGGDQGKAADQLGISRRTLSRKLKAYSMEEPEAGSESAESPRPLGKLSLEQKNCFRAVLEVPALIEIEGQKFEVQALNVSMGGIGVSGLPMKIYGAADVKIQFRLPNRDIIIKALGKMGWIDAAGRAGIKFASIENSDTLEDWIEGQLRKEGWVATPVTV
jgi:two-component system, NtrC family, response regulator AtoC